MKTIGFGILCFGDDHYFKGAQEKINLIRDNYFDCYVLTDQPHKFDYRSLFEFDCILPYNREHKSYYDKILLVKEIHKMHDIAILIDADVQIKEYSFLNQLKTHEFKKGVSYVDVLLNHPSKKRLVMELPLVSREWEYYHDYAKSMLSNYEYMELIWEYFLVFNKDGMNARDFYRNYEILQVAKEFSELPFNRPVNGVGEGISIQIASVVSGTPCQRDMELYEIIKDKMKSISTRFTSK